MTLEELKEEVIKEYEELTEQNGDVEDVWVIEKIGKAHSLGKQEAVENVIEAISLSNLSAEDICKLNALLQAAVGDNSPK